MQVFQYASILLYMKETLFSNLRYFAPTMSILSSSISYSLVVISSNTCSGDAIFLRSCSVAVRFTSLSPSSNITYHLSLISCQVSDFLPAEVCTVSPYRLLLF